MTVRSASAANTGSVGIDLGTTNSVVAVSALLLHSIPGSTVVILFTSISLAFPWGLQVCKGYQTVVIPTSQSTSMLPSIVNIGEGEDIIVGAAAKR